MIKHTFILLTFVFGLFTIPSLYSQPTEKQKEVSIASESGQDYAMLIRKINHLNAAIKTIDMMEADKGNSVGRFEVVICGKGVTRIKENVDKVQRAEKTGIEISVCGMSLNKFSVPKDELPEGISVVPNGLIRLYELQERNYRTLEL